MGEASVAEGSQRRVRRTVREHGPDPVDVHVGKRLRQARSLRGVSQEELGEGIGVSFQAVQKYEQGENRLSASRLFRAAVLLDQTVAFFFEGLESGRTGDGPTDFSRDELELIRHYRRIANGQVRDHLRQVARRVSEIEAAGADGARAPDPADPSAGTDRR
jgi:transcriptional regulator with XRE-family HTH domain